MQAGVAKPKIFLEETTQSAEMDRQILFWYSLLRLDQT